MHTYLCVLHIFINRFTLSGMNKMLCFVVSCYADKMESSDAIIKPEYHQSTNQARIGNKDKSESKHEKLSM
jgi:hypothetical protein